ncbi:hypothetical protein [Roseobacter sp. A03A-229]
MHRFLLSLVAVLVPFCALADEAAQIGIELNAAETDGQSCRLTFVIQNDLAASVDELVLETVLFDAAGQVDRLTLFDFGALPEGRQRVRQFAVDQIDCDDLGHILFNGTERCTGNTLTPAACEAALIARSRTPIEVLQ